MSEVELSSLRRVAFSHTLPAWPGLGSGKGREPNPQAIDCKSRERHGRLARSPRLGLSGSARRLRRAGAIAGPNGPMHPSFSSGSGGSLKALAARLLLSHALPEVAARSRRPFGVCCSPRSRWQRSNGCPWLHEMAGGASEPCPCPLLPGRRSVQKSVFSGAVPRDNAGRVGRGGASPSRE